MSDVFSKRKRSEVMSKIRGRENRGTELALIRLFRSHRVIGWRRHQPVFGKPDFVFPKAKLALFVDGCFWHGCPTHATKPKNNAGFWEQKLGANRARDRKVSRTLREEGWKVTRIWEHELTKRNEERLAMKIRRILTTRLLSRTAVDLTAWSEARKALKRGEYSTQSAKEHIKSLEKSRVKKARH